MQTQPVFQFRPAPAVSARVSAKPGRAIGTLISICDSPAFSRGTEPEVAEPVRDGLGCARAIRAAFVLEGGMGAAVYAIWYFRHFFSAIHLIH